MSDPQEATRFDFISPTDVSPAGDGSFISVRERDLLCALSYAHLACGQTASSLSLLRLATRDHAKDVGVLRIFAYALISEGLGDEALTILDRLDAVDDQPSSRLHLTLLRSHALRQAGRMDEGRAVFQSYVSLRASAVANKQP